MFINKSHLAVGDEQRSEAGVMSNITSLEVFAYLLFQNSVDREYGNRLMADIPIKWMDFFLCSSADFVVTFEQV